jgi:hypothetical protein
MPNAFDMGPDSFASIMLKSPSGFGKTIAASSMCVEGPIWMAYWDKKRPIELWNFYTNIIKRPELLKNIHYEIYGSDNASEYLSTLIRFINQGCPYFGIVNDSVTFMTSAAVGWSMGFRTKGGKKDKVDKDAPQLIPDFDEYKVETSLVTQSLDICKSLPCHNIWTAHPLPTLKVEGSGASIRVASVKNIVSYGQKVGAIIPGGFTEIYHLALDTDYNANPVRTRRIAITNSIGDDFAKTSLGLPKELDITDRLFWEVWKEAIKNKREVFDESVKPITPSVSTPFVEIAVNPGGYKL